MSSSATNTMRRYSGPIVFALAVIYTLAMSAIHEHLNQLHAHIADLEQRNEALARLCGAVMCVPCNKGESGVQCQARMGAIYKVIYYPAAEAYVAELKAEVEP